MSLPEKDSSVPVPQAMFGFARQFHQEPIPSTEEIMRELREGDLGEPEYTSASDDVLSDQTWAEIGRRIALDDSGLIDHVDGATALARIREEFGMV